MLVNEMEKNLKGSYNDAYSTVLQYAINKGYTNERINESMSDLYELLMTAQENGRPVEKVIGKDMMYFCRNYFGDYTFVDVMKNVAEFLFRSFVFVILWELFIAVIYSDGIMRYFCSDENIFGYIVGMGLGAVVMIISSLVVAPLTAKKKKYGDISNFLLCISFFVIIISLTLFSDYDIVELNVKTWMIMLFSTLYVLTYFIIRSFIRYKRNGTIKDIYKKSFKENYIRSLINVQVEKGMLEGMQKRYKRLSKKGKVTAESFTDKIKKEQKFNKVADIFVTSFYIVCAMVMCLDILRGSEGVLIKLICVGIYCGIAYIAFLIFVKPMRSVTIFSEKMLYEAEKSGLTIPEIIDRKLLEHK